jgi:uncharacterized protein YecE (DUF72 family)
VRGFCDVAQTLGPKLGVLLFQLPPTFRKNLDAFDAFLACLPKGARAAFEFRHTSWHDDDVLDRLRGRNLALCIADSERGTAPIQATADYGYFRLRDEGYVEQDIHKWGDHIRRLMPNWREAFVYFKHEEEGKGPEFAKVLMDYLGSPGPGVRTVL